MEYPYMLYFGSKKFRVKIIRIYHKWGREYCEVEVDPTSKLHAIMAKNKDNKVIIYEVFKSDLKERKNRG